MLKFELKSMWKSVPQSLSPSERLRCVGGFYSSINFALILPRSRNAAMRLTCFWRTPLHQMSVFVGMDEVGGLCSLPYGFIFQLSQWPGG